MSLLNKTIAEAVEVIQKLSVFEELLQRAADMVANCLIIGSVIGWFAPAVRTEPRPPSWARSGLH